MVRCAKKPAQLAAQRKSLSFCCMLCWSPSATPFRLGAFAHLCSKNCTDGISSRKRYGKKNCKCSDDIPPASSKGGKAKQEQTYNENELRLGKSLRKEAVSRVHLGQNHRTMPKRALG